MAPDNEYGPRAPGRVTLRVDDENTMAVYGQELILPAEGEELPSSLDACATAEEE